MMSNITKNFKAKAKRGLCMAQGGLLEQQVQQTLQPQTAAPAPAYMDWQERENAEKTARWRQDDLLSRGVAPQQTATLGTALQQPQQAAKPGAAPAYTDWQERENAEKTARWRQDDLLSSAGRGRGLRMADGGMVPETAEQVMARMASKYGTTGAAQAAPVAQPAPAPVQVQQPAPQPKPTGGLFGRALGGLRQANEQLRQVTNYAEGGIVRGKGGPTDDEVPMSIGGTDVNLSNKEAVLPAKTVAALGGPEAVEELIEETNGKPPVRGGLRAGGAYEGGTGGWSLGSGQKPTIYDNGGLPAQVVQAGVDTMRGQLADTRDPRRMSSGAIREVGADLGAAKEDPEALMQRVAATRGVPYVAPAPSTAPVSAQGAPTDPDTDGRRTYSTPTAPAFVNRGAKPTTTLKDAETAVDPRDLHAKILAQGTTVVNGKPTQGDAKYSMLKHVAEQEAKNPNIMGLRAAGVTGDVMGDVTENGKTGKTGIRTITTGSGNIYAGRDAKGQLNITAGLEKGSPADIDKARDAEFAAKGYGKDANGHWMTPGRLGAKTTLRDLQYQNAKFNATSDQITDPNARAAGMRGLAQYDVEEKQKAETAKNAASAESARIGHLLTEQGQRITLRGQDNMQANNERDFRQGVSEKVNKRVEEMLNLHAPTTGLKDDALPVAQARRADMQEAMYSMFGKNMPQDDATLNKAMPQMLSQAKASLAIRDAVKNRGFWNKVGNVGSDPWTTLHGAKLALDGKNIRFENGFTIPVDEVIKDGNAKNADILAALQARTVQK
jgi:hypothetical protein